MGVVEPKPSEGAPDWIVTFADMISLLVTFFILLLTFSSMEADEAFQVQGKMEGTTGTLAHSKGSSAITPPKMDVMLAMDAARGAQSPHSRPTEELLDQVASKEGQRKTDEHQEVNLSAARDGLAIGYDDRASFQPGSVELSAYLKKSLAELGRVVEHYPQVLLIEGHTDDQFKPSAKYPTAAALSLGRAQAAAEHLLENSNLSRTQVQFSAHGANHPKAPNDTPEGRRTNRRIELRILSLSQARAASLKEERQRNG